MGNKTSLVASYCTQIDFQLSEETLLSLGYEKLSQNAIKSFDAKSTFSPNSNFQLYKQTYSQEIFILQSFSIKAKYVNQVKSIANRLLYNNSKNLDSILFYSVSKSKNIFRTEEDTQNFRIFRKILTTKFLDTLQNHTLEEYSNIQLCHLLKNIATISESLFNIQQSTKLISLNPNHFYVLSSQKFIIQLAYSIDMKTQCIQNNNLNANNYYAPEYFQSKFYKTNKLTQEQKQKCLMFSTGMVLLHFLLNQSCLDCYNMKETQVCRSQVQNKMEKLYKKLNNRLQRKYTKNQNSGNISPFSHISIQNSQIKSFQQQLYTMIAKLIDFTGERLSIQQLKSQINSLFKLVSQNFINQSSNIINDRSNTQFVKNESIQSTQQQTSLNPKKYIFKRLDLTQNEQNDSRLQNSNSYDMSFPYIKTMKRKKRVNQDKQNINRHYGNIEQKLTFKGSENSQFQFPNKIIFNDNSIIQGYFNQNRAHGLGQVLKTNGTIQDCIFDNQQLIQQIKPLF